MSWAEEDKPAAPKITRQQVEQSLEAVRVEKRYLELSAQERQLQGLLDQMKADEAAKAKKEEPKKK